MKPFKVPEGRHEIAREFIPVLLRRDTTREFIPVLEGRDTPADENIIRFRHYII